MSESKKDLQRFDDIDTINIMIDDYLNLIDHLSGNGFSSSPAPDRMNRLPIKIFKQRVAFLTANRMAIQLSKVDQFKNQANCIRKIRETLPIELKKQGVCDLQIPKYETIRKWIGSDASKTYPDP